ncbi:ras guanine nucleotide exchange factor domain-containing protein [Lentinula raphanica]|nr:ras guanine nucleotide exchange factor domain-containing protein [Lentinula raphanica]
MAQPLDDTPSPNHAIQPLLTDTLLNNSLPSPAGSFVSKESYSTAISSPTQTDLENFPTTQPIPNPNPSSLVSAQNLRKSISADSFVHYGRETLSPVVTRPNRGHTGSALEPPTGLVGLRRGLNHINQPGRSRGDSISSVKSSLAEDSDADRSDIFNSSTERYRQVLKPQDQARTFVSGDELPLPSRTPTLSTTSSMSSIMSTTTSSSTQEAASSLRSASSMQAPPRPMVTTGRARSGSLGIYPQSTRKIHINTQVTSEQSQAITLAVVGTAGCGKSTAIRKGLKNNNLSEPSGHIAGPHPSIRHTRRTGKFTRDEGTECPLHVIEVDVAAELLQPPISPLDLLPEALKIDGVIVCYDASDKNSFKNVEDLLSAYRSLQIPVIVFACKSDLERKVDPLSACETLSQYDVGLVEVDHSDAGKDKMKRSFDFLLIAIVRERRNGPTLNRHSEDYRNPASPEIPAASPSWDRPDGSRTATPTASSASSTSHIPLPGPIVIQSSLPTIPASRTTSVPTSPTRARSTGDLLYEQRSRCYDTPEVQQPSTNETMTPATNDSNGNSTVDRSPTNDFSPPSKVENKEKEMRPAQWATLDELLDKLLFLAVSGDDPTFVTHFLLTYRRFASPRSLLLAMQKRMRQLDNPSGDPMFACFAQMKICHLLEVWIRDYPYDFAVRGTAGALSALIKSIISKTYLLHYGSDFLPFLEVLPTLVDRDSAWALKVDDAADSDDSYSLLEDDDESVKSAAKPPSSPPVEQGKTSMSIPSRSRKSSIPLLTAKVLFPNSIGGTVEPDNAEFSAKQQLRELVKLANEVHMLDSEEIAQEITRIEKQLFLDIEPRHWLHFTFVSGKKDPETNTIVRFNTFSNHLGDWVVSLILCHDRPRDRARQIEKFVDVAQKLRGMNNYSALRAVVAGINNSTFPGDLTMEKFKQRAPDSAKALRSWDVLLQAIRAHRAYRMALRNTKGATIPALEVHMSDLIRAHEGNDDSKSDDPTKIHWGKFNMIGRFITSTTQCQAQCRSTTDYNFPERLYISNLLLTKYIMDDEMQKSRIAPQDNDYDEYASGIPSTTLSTQINPPKDVARLRRIFFKN